MSCPEKGSVSGSNKKTTSPLRNGGQRQSFDLRSLVSNMFHKKGPPTKLTMQNSLSSSSKFLVQSQESNSNISTTKMDGKLGKNTTTNLDVEKPTSPAVIPVIKRHADIRGQPRSSSLNISKNNIDNTQPSLKTRLSIQNCVEKPKLDNYSNNSPTIPPTIDQKKSTNDKVLRKPTALKSNNLNQKQREKSVQKKKAMPISEKEPTPAILTEKELTSNTYQNNKTKLLHPFEEKEYPIKSKNLGTSLNSPPLKNSTTSKDSSLQILANEAELMRRKQRNIANENHVSYDSSKIKSPPLDEDMSGKSKSQTSTTHDDQGHPTPSKQFPSIQKLQNEKHSIPQNIHKTRTSNVRKKTMTLSQPQKKKVDKIEESSKSQISQKPTDSQIENKKEEISQTVAHTSSSSPVMENVHIIPFQKSSNSTLEQNTTIDKDDPNLRPEFRFKGTRKSNSLNCKRIRASDSDIGLIPSKESTFNNEKESFETHHNATPGNSFVKSGTGNSGMKKSRKYLQLSSPNEGDNSATQDKLNDIVSLGSRADPSTIKSQLSTQIDKSSKKSDQRSKSPKKIFDVEFIGQHSSMSKTSDDDSDNTFTQTQSELNPLWTGQEEASCLRSKSFKIDLKKTDLNSGEAPSIWSKTVIMDLCVAENIPLSILDETKTSKQEIGSHKKGRKTSNNKRKSQEVPLLENPEKTSTKNSIAPHMAYVSSEINIHSVEKSKAPNVSKLRSHNDLQQQTELHSQDQSHVIENYSKPQKFPENINSQESSNPEIAVIEKNNEMSTNTNSENIVALTTDANLNNDKNESLPTKRKRKRNPKYFDKSQESPLYEASVRRSSRKRKPKTVESPTKDIKQKISQAHSNSRNLTEAGTIIKETSPNVAVSPIRDDAHTNSAQPIAQKVSNPEKTNILDSNPICSQDKLDKVSITGTNEKKRNYGPESDRTCPYCKQVFSIITGLAYHIEHKICLHSDQRKIKSMKSLSGTMPFQKLRGGEYFVTKFGVVRVIKDDRAPDDLNSTTIPDKIAALSHNYTRKKERVIKRKESMVMYAAKLSRRRRKTLTEIWLKKDSGGYTQKNVWPLYCKLALPKDILAGLFQRKRDEKIKRKPVSLENHPWLNFGENPLVPRDSYPHRMVECVLIADEREQIMSLEYDCQREDRSSTLTGAVASIRKCLDFQKPSNEPNSLNHSLHSSGMKLFLRRNTLINPYNPYIPAYKCYKCGSEFECRQSLKHHLEVLPCERRRVEYLEATKLRLEEIDKSMNEKKIKPPQHPNRLVPPGEKPKPRIKLKENPNIPGWIKFNPHRSPIYPEVFKFQEFRRGSNNRHFIQKIFEKSGPSRKRQRKSKSKANNILSRPMYFEIEKYLFGKPIICSYRQAVPRVNSAWTKPDKPKRGYNNVTVKEEDTENFDMATQISESNSNAATTIVTKNSEQPTFASKIEHTSPVNINPNKRLKNSVESIILGEMASPTKQKSNVGREPKSKSLENNDKTDTTPTASTPKKKSRKRSTMANPKPPGPPVIVDMMVLVEEIDTGRYPSIKRFYGEHSDVCVLCRGGTGDLFRCVFCSNTEHLECVRTKLTIREPEPEDDFMCHRCIQIVLARRSRAEKRRLKKREEWLGKAGIPDPSVATNLENKLMSPATMLSPANTLPVNPAIAMLNPSALNPVVQAAATVERELVWNQSEFDSHVKTYDKCPTGGPGGLICCALCSSSYSRLLTNTAKEMETQTVAKIGREVCELVELLRDAQLRLQQAVDVSNANECRRNLLDRNEIDREPSSNHKDNHNNDNTDTMI